MPQEKKKSKKSKKDKKEKRDREKDSRKDRHHDGGGGRDSSKKDKAHESTRKDSIESADEEGQVVPGKAAAPASKRPRTDGESEGSDLPGRKESDLAEENGNGSSVPL